MVVTKLNSGVKKWESDFRNSQGRRVRKRFKTKREAEAYEADQLRLRDASSDSNTYAMAAEMTVEDLFNLWWERATTKGISRRGPLGERTQVNRLSLWESRVAPVWRHVRLDTITHDKAEEWLSAEKTKPRTSQHTLHAAGTLLLQVLDEGVRRGILQGNPAKDRLGHADYVPPNSTAKAHVYLTVEQLILLAENMLTPRDKAIVLLGGLSGLRFGEVAALDWEDLDLARREVRVHQAYSHGKSERHLLKGTKSGLERQAPLHEVTVQALTSYGLKASGRVFSSRLGNPLKADSWRTRLNPVVSKLQAKGQLPKITFHDLRHTAVSIAVSANVNVKVVQSIAGHASAVTTLDTYAGLFREDLSQATSQVDEILRGRFLDT